MVLDWHILMLLAAVFLIAAAATSYYTAFHSAEQATKSLRWTAAGLSLCGFVSIVMAISLQ